MAILAMKPDATALATVLVAATDGLKDLSDIVDPPSRARRGFEDEAAAPDRAGRIAVHGPLSRSFRIFQGVAHDVVAAAVVGAQVEVAVVG